MKIFLQFVLSCLATIGATLVTLEPDQQLEPPSYWTKEGRADYREELSLVFAVKQAISMETMEIILMEVSDPASVKYGMHLTLEKLTEMVAPTKLTLQIVESWLGSTINAEAQCNTVETRDFLECKMTVAEAEKLLNGAKFYRFRRNRDTVLRSATRYAVPEKVAPHLDFVSGVHRFPGSGNKLSQEYHDFSDPSVHLGVTPTVLRKRYNLSDSDVGSHPDNTQATAQFLGQFFSQADLAEFMKLFVGDDFVHRDAIDKIVGPDSGMAGLEASLDVQYIMSTGANISTQFWSTAGTHESQEPFVNWMMKISNTSSVPWVHSVSYSDYEDTLSLVYMNRCSMEFMKAGARGLSLLFASGDNGAGCRDVGNDTYMYRPMFPSSCPYVTTIGGTSFRHPYSIGEEVSAFISGGGFSNVFSQPLWQKKQVRDYLSTCKDMPPSMYYNASGRGFPDLAALSTNYWIVRDRVPTPYISGTSCATPTWSGVISLLNDIRLRQQKSSLGFLNPIIYSSLRTALYDVFAGCHVGCLDDRLEGFCAISGWDPVTGMGTPDFSRLSKIVRDL